MTTGGSYVHNSMVNFWGHHENGLWEFSQNIDGFRQNNSIGLLQLYIKTKPILRIVFHFHYLPKLYIGFNPLETSPKYTSGWGLWGFCVIARSNHLQCTFILFLLSLLPHPFYFTRCTCMLVSQKATLFNPSRQFLSYYDISTLGFSHMMCNCISFPFSCWLDPCRGTSVQIIFLVSFIKTPQLSKFSN